MEEFIYITITLILFSYAYIKIAEYFNIVDKPNHRSSHTQSTIRGGGILFLIALLLFYVVSDFQYTYFVLGTSIIAVVSFIDDIVTLSSKLRLPFQFVAVGLCLYQLDFGIIGINDLLLFLPLLVLCIAFINIYNFMDGINGLTGIYSIVVLAGFYSLSINIEAVNNDLIIYTLISLCVFGFYNFRKKARFFAGDIGSITIGMIILFVGFSLLIASTSPLVLLFVAVYSIDGLYIIIYRILIKEKLTEPHRYHLYQKSVDIFKLSHLKVSFIYAMIQLLINVVIYYCYEMDLILQYTIAASILIVLSIMYIFIFKLAKARMLKDI